MRWKPEVDLNITTYATIGVSDKPMPGVDYRVELHMSVEGKVEEDISSIIKEISYNV
jgi:hypothetical protein